MEANGAECWRAKLAFRRRWNDHPGRKKSPLFYVFLSKTLTSAKFRIQFFPFLVVLNCNRYFGSRNTFVLFHVISKLGTREDKVVQHTWPPRGAPDDWTLGPSLLTVFYKTWTNPPFVPRCSSFINIKSDLVKLWQPVISRCWSINYQSDLSEREYNTYFSVDGGNVETESLKQLDYWLVIDKHKGEQRKKSAFTRGAGVWTTRRKRTWVEAADRGRRAARQHDGAHEFSERNYRRGCNVGQIHELFSHFFYFKESDAHHAVRETTTWWTVVPSVRFSVDVRFAL